MIFSLDKDRFGSIPLAYILEGYIGRRPLKAIPGRNRMGQHGRPSWTDSNWPDLYSTFRSARLQERFSSGISSFVIFRAVFCMVALWFASQALACEPVSHDVHAREVVAAVEMPHVEAQDHGRHCLHPCMQCANLSTCSPGGCSAPLMLANDIPPLHCGHTCGRFAPPCHPLQSHLSSPSGKPPRTIA